MTRAEREAGGPADETRLGSAFARAQRDPVFLAAFTKRYEGRADPIDALRWLEDPTAMGATGALGPDAVERAARNALYRPDVDEQKRTDYWRLRAGLDLERSHARTALDAVVSTEREAEEVAAEGGPLVNGGALFVPLPLHPSRRYRVVLLAVAIGLCSAGIGWGVLFDGRPRARPAAAAPIAQLLGSEPTRLPAIWRRGTVVSSSDALDGAMPLIAPAGQDGRLLLVVRCPSSDRSFQALVTGDGPPVKRFGACGRLQSLPLPVRPDALLRIVVTTRGLEPFSAALVRR